MSDKEESINKLMHQLREIINRSIVIRNSIYQKKDGTWDRLWAAMDALEDAQVAIESFQNAPTVSYLELYGLLQAFIVQQDGIDHIRQTSVAASKIKWSEDEPILNEIRRLRNETTGHPSEIKTKDGVAYCNINRSSITKQSFEYILWSSKGAKHIKMNILDNISSQEKELNRLLRRLIDDIETKERKFMESFSNKPVKQVYLSINYYYFEKMYGHSNNPILAQSMFEAFSETYLKVRKMLEERYGDFNSTINVPGLKLVIDEMDELLRRIKDKFSMATQDEFDNHVYIEALERKWEELGGMVDETDQKFAQNDKSSQ